MFLRHSSSLERSPCRIREASVGGSKILRSALVCFLKNVAQSSPDPILDLDCLMLLECNHLSKIFGAFFSG